MNLSDVLEYKILGVFMISPLNLSLGEEVLGYLDLEMF